jgi:hypothetical protein
MKTNPSPAWATSPKASPGALDELIQGALAYHTGARLTELLDFTRRLPRYSPFNCLLLHIQNPRASFVASSAQWHRLGRSLATGARPLLILAPMRPVMFVFDVTDTSGAPLPEQLLEFTGTAFDVVGHVSTTTWKRILHQSAKAGISIECVFQPPNVGGSLQRDHTGHPCVRLNATHSLSEQFATLTHELAHLFCGHVGRTMTEPWPHRSPNLTLATREFEAEAASWLVCQRFGLRPASQRYLAPHLAKQETLPPFSLEAILVAAGVIEDMARGRTPTRLRAAKSITFTPSTHS